MRRITEHRIEEHGFEDAVRGLVRNAPWWMISIGFHAVVALILWSVPFRTEHVPPVLQVQSGTVPPPPPPEVVDAPKPEVTLETIEEKVVPADEFDARVESDADSDFAEAVGEEGLSESLFTGPSDNAAIGIGPGAGGGPGGRGGSGRGKGHQSGGKTYDEVELGLKWLADHQDVETNGGWDCDDFMKHDPADDKCDGPGKPHYDAGVTGLALLAFLGAGYTDRGSERDNPFGRNVRQGLRYLMNVQDDDGCFGPRASRHFFYNHVIATLAMTEAYWMTRNPLYRKPAQEGIDFLAAARNPYAAWRYNPRSGDNDTSVTGWCVMALKSAKLAGLDIDPDAFDGARRWIDKMTDPEYGRVGYTEMGGAPARPEGLQDRFPPEKSESMTAVGVLTRIFLGEDPSRSEMIRKGVGLMVRALPEWEPERGNIDMYYWYYGTLAMFQVGGTPWNKWNDAMLEAVVRSQHGKGSGGRTGSWDPIGPWGPDGGRVYATATMVMCLEVYYRYDRVVGTR